MSKELDEIFPQYTISMLREDRNEWYKTAQELNISLQKQDKVIDDYRKQVKFLKSELERIEKEKNTFEHAHIEQTNVVRNLSSRVGTLENYLERINRAVEQNEIWKAEDVLYTWRGYE